MTRMTVLQLCQSLEEHADRAADGTWRCNPGGQVLTDGHWTPHYEGGVVAESLMLADQAHIVRTQPQVTKAIAAKLREAHSLLQEATRIISALRYDTGGEAGYAAAVGITSGTVNALQDRLIAFPMIEVP